MYSHGRSAVAATGVGLEESVTVTRTDPAVVPPSGAVVGERIVVVADAGLLMVGVFPLR